MAEFSHTVGGKGIWVREITNLNFYLLRSHLHDSSLQFVLLERLDGLLNSKFSQANVPLVVSWILKRCPELAEKLKHSVE